MFRVLKQVQDLQNQVAELTQANTHLRTRAAGKEDSVSDRAEAKRRLSAEHTGPPAVRNRVAAPVMRDFEHVALLLSIFAAESNMRQVGSMWLASAVRAAQELCINTELESWPVVEGEMRRRLWWALYSRDRLTSFETNKPMLINDNDCDVSLPSPAEDRYVQPQGFFRTHANTAPFTGSLAVVQVTRMYAPLYQALKSSTLSPQTVQNFELQFRTRAQQLPEAYQIGSAAALETAALPPLFALLSAQFHLYRRNTSPVCHASERREALRLCASVAQDTAKYVSRALHNPPTAEMEKSWPARVAPMASSLTCLHLWRCILILCFRADYDAALMCSHMLSATGSLRRIGVGCGKNLVFVLDKLLDRVRSGHGAPPQLEYDEEILAYISGDVQASLDHGWAWAGSDVAAAKSPASALYSAPGLDHAMRDRPVSSSPVHDWDGWGRVDQLIRQLMDEHRPRTAQAPAYYPPPHNPVKRVQLGPVEQSPPKPAPLPSPAPSNASRISIANII
ncbi:hypothetical protein N0V95_008383 [Ascochyta clinopodiicola]|nr:hypothetical protein N0V95_008383 [Ascochyta clinopodiicola]